VLSTFQNKIIHTSTGHLKTEESELQALLQEVDQRIIFKTGY